MHTGLGLCVVCLLLLYTIVMVDYASINMLWVQYSPATQQGELYPLDALSSLCLVWGHLLLPPSETIPEANTDSTIQMVFLTFSPTKYPCFANLFQHTIAAPSSLTKIVIVWWDGWFERSSLLCLQPQCKDMRGAQGVTIESCSGNKQFWGLKLVQEHPFLLFFSLPLAFFLTPHWMHWLNLV